MYGVVVLLWCALGRGRRALPCQDQPLHSLQASCTPINKVWDLGNKSVVFSLPLFLYSSWSSLLLSGEAAPGSWGWHPSCCQPFSPITFPMQGCARPCCEAAGRGQTEPWGQCQSSSVLAPRAHRQWLPSRSGRLAGQCCALALPGTRGKVHSKASARHSHAGEKPAAP